MHKPADVIATIRVPADLDREVRQLAASRRISFREALQACTEAGARLYRNFGPIGLRELTNPPGGA